MLCEIVVVLIIFTALSERKQEAGERQAIRADSRRKIYTGLVFLGILLLVGTRIFRFGQVPGGINQDEAMAAVDAYALANYGTDRFGMSYPVHFTAWGYGQMSVLLSYLMAPFMKAGGLSVFTARLPMLTVSLAGAFFLFLLLKDTAGRRAGLIVLYLTALNPWHFMQSRWALDCNVFPHMFVIGLYFLNRGIKKARFLYVSMFFFALCMYSYGVSFYMVPFFLLVVCIAMNVMKKINLRRSFALAAVYLFFSWPIYLTMFINFMGIGTIRFFHITIPYFEGSVRAGDILFFSEHPWQQLGNNLHSLIHVVFVQGGDYLWNAIDNFGTIYWCTMPFVVTGLVVCILKIREEKEKRISYLIFLTYWCFGLLVGVLIASVNVNRINIVFYAQLILAAVGMDYILKKKEILLLPVCIVYLFMSVLFTRQYYHFYAERIQGIFFADFIEAIEDAADYESSRYYIALATEYNEAANCAEILTLYAQKVDALYFQGQTSQFLGKDIAYKERYYYRIPTEEEVRQNKDTVYILRNSQRERFDPDKFTIREYGEFIMIY